jgi:hypothetical protein
MKGGTKMERIEMSKKGLYIGTGAGLILFVMVGLLSGSLIGGVAGLKIAGLLGAPVEATLVSRMIVALSMVAGVIGSAVFFIAGMGALGWAGGFLFEAFRKQEVSAVKQTM